MLYAAEWPCCHDPLRLGLCFEDLSTHARAPRVVDNPLPTHATCAAPLRCHRAARAGGSPSFFSLQSPRAAGEKRARATARAHVLKTRQLHIFILLKSAPADRLHPSLSHHPVSISSTGRRRETCTSHSSRARARHGSSTFYRVKVVLGSFLGT